MCTRKNQVGFYGDFIKYSFDCPLSMVTECDGIRIVTEKASSRARSRAGFPPTRSHRYPRALCAEQNCQFLQRVPESTEAIFKIGSTTPAARLFDATEAFESKSVEADTHIRSIKDKDELKSAIDQCVRCLFVRCGCGSARMIRAVGCGHARVQLQNTTLAAQGAR